MFYARILVLTLLAGVSPLALAAVQARLALPTGGIPIIADPVAAVRPRVGDHGRVEVVDVAGPGFTRAVRLTTARRGSDWSVSVNLPVERPMKKGEAILFGIWARTLSTRHESGQGMVHFHLSELQGPWMQEAGSLVTFTQEWQQFYARGVCSDNYAPNRLALKLFAGQVEQVIEIGGIELLSYGVGLDVENLPRTRVTYAGREADATWRRDAEQRIRDLRTAPLAVQVIGRDGKPVADATVRLELVRNAFDFGLAIDAGRLMDREDPRSDLLRRKLVELFNSASFMNDLKWEAWIGEWGAHRTPENALAALRWLRDNRISFRGHVMVWPSFRNMPRFLRDAKERPSPEALQALVLSRIDEIAGWTSGYADEWDVLNEPHDNHDVMDLCGNQVMVDWFKRARERLPNVRLALNDYGLLTPLADSPKQQQFEETVRYLLDNGAPVDVIGLQGHFGSTVPAPKRMLATLDRFARLGPKIRITEYGVAGDDDDLKHDFTRDLLTVLYSHPHVIGFQSWWGLPRWVNDDGSLTRQGEAYYERVHRAWKTDVTLTTDAAGRCEAPGHLGRYRIRVSSGQRSTETWLDLRKGSVPVIVTLP